METATGPGPPRPSPPGHSREAPGPEPPATGESADSGFGVFCACRQVPTHRGRTHLLASCCCLCWALHVAPGAGGTSSVEGWTLQQRGCWKEYSRCDFFVVNLFLAALGLRCSVRAFSSCGERRLLSSFGVVASTVAEHSSRVWGLQYLWCISLVSLRHVESSQTTDQTCVPGIGRILYH